MAPYRTAMSFSGFSFSRVLLSCRSLLSSKVPPMFRLFLFSLFVFSLCLSVSRAEKKVSVSEVVFDSSVEDIQWLGPDHSTVVCRTTGGRLYRSLDSGRNWSEITDLLKQVARSSAKSATVVESIIVNPTDKDIILVVGRKHNHFISRDAARSFTLIEHSGTIHSFLFHPTHSHWALMSRWTEACNNSGTKQSKSPCRHDLFVTKDLGDSFALLTNYVVQFSWGDPKTDQADAVFFTHYDNGKGVSQPRAGGWSENVHFSRAVHPGASPKRLISQGNKFLVSNGYIFVAKLLDPDRQTVSLLVSTDGGKEFAPAKLPVELQERSYTILDTSEGSVMLHVNHGHSSEAGVNVGNVYISDAAGLRYSLSLPKNVRTSTGECEFDKVSALEGVYIANFRAEAPTATEESTSTYEDDEDNDDEEDEDELDALETGVERRGRHSMSGKQEVFVKTVISFDKGGIWSYLKPPKIDSRGKKIDCATTFESPTKANATARHTTDFGYAQPTDCWLHLHGITNFHRYAPFYSISNAVGIIMGTGNVGDSLRYEEDQVNTYLSRDGGLNWVEAHKGAYIYEFGDHGGLVVMADDVRKTNQVVFSWNEGQSWYDFDLGDQSINVDNVVIEPNSSSVEFLLYGTRGGAGVLYHLDFATLDQPACKGVWAADSVSSDYETWIPTDGRTGDNCILGRHLTFTRRKQTSECFNGVDFSRPILKKNCTCTERDYECEFGFTRKVGGTLCIPEDPTLTQEGCRSSGIFMADAYRRIPGDTCVGGWTPSKVPVLCPSSSPFSGRAKTVLLSILGVIGALGVVTLMNENPRFKGLLGNVGVDSLTNAKYAVLGGAARFLDAFDSPETGTFTAINMASDSDTLKFIEAEQQADELDAPPLLDFSSGRIGEPFENVRFSNDELYCVVQTGRRGLQTASESVPRLLPPPSRNEPAVKEFEML